MDAVRSKAVFYGNDVAETPFANVDAILCIGVARILSGVHFFLPKKLTTFFSRRPQRQSKYTHKSNPLSKNCPKNSLLLWLGCTSCPGEVHLHISL